MPDDIIDRVSTRFTESPRSYKFKRTLFGAVLSFLIGIVGIFQTRTFIARLPGLDETSIRQHVTQCRRFQSVKRNNSTQTKSGIVVELFDTDKQKQSIEDARDSLLKDEELQSVLYQKFGVSFRDLDVVIIPAWKMDTPDNIEQLGITINGWRQASTAKGEANVGGFTLRDRPTDARPTTLDGRPRIVINPKAFESEKALQLVVFHELLHAMNVPGFYPWPLTFAQNDLTYLEEYRHLVKRGGLEAWDGWDETRTWVLAVFVPWLICALLIRQIWIYRGSL
jgi:hypothetical protein